MERAKIGLLLAKLETTYGTDPTPTAAANVIAVTRGEVSWEQGGEAIDRNILDGGFGRVVGVTALPMATVKFRTELRGNRTTGASNTDISSGEVANLIPLDPLFRACDLPPAYTAESSDGVRDGYALYTPTIPTSQGGIGESVTIWFYSEGKLYKANGCKGNFSIGGEAGKFAYIDWEFMGLHVAPADSSIPGSPTFLDCKPPQWLLPSAAATAPNWSAQAVTATNATDVINLTAHGLFNGDRVKFGGTPPAGLTAGTWYYVVNRAANTFKVAATLGGSLINLTDDGTSVTLTSAPGVLWDTWTGPVLSKFALRLGNSVVRREDGGAVTGIQGFVIADRDSGGEIDPESVAEATHPIWADHHSSRSKPLRINIGTLGGNRICIEALTRINTVRYEDRNGRRIQNVNFAIRNSALGEAAGSEFRLLFQ